MQNYRRWSPDTAVELQTGEMPVEISVDDPRLGIWETIQLWNCGVRFTITLSGHFILIHRAGTS